LCGTTHCQRVDLAAITPRLEAAAAATAGELLWYEGRPAFAVYSQDCGGVTEDVSAMWPEVAASYLRQQTDPYCVRGGGTTWQWKAKTADLLAALRASQLRTPHTVDHIVISGRTASGRARELTLAGQGESVPISATSFRFAVGRALGWGSLRSDRYEIAGLEFHGSGSGHGVGLCQRGADQMGNEGRSYHEILAFYYPGTQVGRTGRGISWTRLGGEHITLFTTHPDRDSTVLALAERELGEAVRKTNLAAPRGVEIRLYPDVATFRDATGEPGWVAAHTVGVEIHLQPSPDLRPTLRHEFLHVLVESHTTAPLPVWFREGLVEYLENPDVARPAAKPPSDADLRQTADPRKARRAYNDAAASVADLVHRHGASTVLSWLTKGMPK
jgi:stage II sporulation protein D